MSHNPLSIHPALISRDCPDEEERGGRGCELWTRVKALEEYVFSQDRMASLADAVHDPATVCFPESSIVPPGVFPGRLPGHTLPADVLTYAPHHEDTPMSLCQSRITPSKDSSSSVHSISPNSGLDPPFTYIYHAQNALNLDLYGDGPTRHDTLLPFCPPNFSFDSTPACNGIVVAGHRDLL